MQFKHPEILYFLGLLIIPILVHLFQLQKFKKVSFTNVAFLQKIALQTRKSSRLKKWLILASRILLLTAIIFAFSQPYFSTHKVQKKQKTFIYLDNSLSTKSTGKKGDLLQISAQELIEEISEKEIYSLLTNDAYFENISAQKLKKTLLTIKNTGKSTQLNNVFLKINSQKNNEIKSLNNNILISDFQIIKKIKNQKFTNVKQEISFVKLNTEAKNNISIDSVFISSNNTTNFSVYAVVKNQGEKKENVPISLFDDEKLISKLSFSIDKNTEKNIEFKVENKLNFNGKIHLNFNDTFIFDNHFFFNKNLNTKIKVLSIGKYSNFLTKIYNKKEFIFSETNVQNINYNTIQKQQLIILNELEEIPSTLQKTIKDFTINGGHLIIIPNETIKLNSYNQFFTALKIGSVREKNKDTLKITQINYEHPLFKNVFSKKTTNFQYPFSKTHYISTIRGSSIVDFENNQPFIKQVDTKNSAIYWVANSLNTENTNFTNSPLVVPIFYNIGQQSLQRQRIYYTIGKENKIDIDIKLEKDEVLSISSLTGTTLIPLQQNYQNKTSIITKENITKDGFYSITNKKDTIKTLAFNYPKEESLMNFINIEKFASKNDNMQVSDSIASLFSKISKKNEVHWLWKWFLGIAIVSLLLEILILKFFKQ